MEITNHSPSISSLHQQIALKKSQLASIDKEELQSTFEKKDSVNITGSSRDENDYQRVLDKFKALDAKTKTHEQAHASGATTTSAISYNYQVGPDGKLYATGGHVRFDTSIPSDPKAALAKLDKLANAASAPDELSAADASIARTANLNRMLLLSQEETPSL